MKKLNIILDSFSGLTKKQVEKEGYGFIPLQIILDDETFKDGIDFESAETAIEKIKNAKHKNTSQPNLMDIENTFKEQLKIAEKVIYIPMGSKLSSTFAAANVVSEKIGNNKVVVLNNSFAGPAFMKIAKFLDNEVNTNNRNIDEVLAEVSAWDKKINTWIIPKSIDSIKKSGRIKKGATFLLSKLSIIPLISYKNSQIEIKSVRRGFIKATSEVISRIMNTIGKFKDDYDFYLLHTNTKETIDIAANKLKELGIKFTQVIAAAIIITQCGIGGISIVSMPKNIKNSK